MTPKEKAEELIKKFNPFVYCHLGSGILTNTESYSAIIHSAKKCALITVDEISNAIDWHEFEVPNKEIVYWQEVKQEIEKL
jgi:hypothetical protein